MLLTLVLKSTVISLLRIVYIKYISVWTLNGWFRISKRVFIITYFYYFRLICRWISIRNIFKSSIQSQIPDKQKVTPSMFLFKKNRSDFIILINWIRVEVHFIDPQCFPFKNKVGCLSLCSIVIGCILKIITTVYGTT